MDVRSGNTLKATTGVWLAVLALTVATALFFDRMTPDAPLKGTSLVFVAFFWFLVVFALRWAWQHYHKKEAGK
ncbi:MAG TPA: hypothetical protein VMG35_15600 [Bryobacteraceae bacterium]|nr:hypothetical protein [Bryobacteraceae bacterium]